VDPGPGITYFVGQISKALLSPGSHASVLSLVTAFAIALVVLALRRHKKGRRIRLKSLLRALFPKSVVMSRSSLADAGYFYFNLFLFGIIFGWALISYDAVSRNVAGALSALLGPLPPAPLPAFACRMIITVILFLAYELGYWFNHYLAHRIPFLWEFHKVHHSATVLTPLTNFRVHPVYMCIFLNILALATGLASGIGSYLLGQPALQYGVSETNIILVFFIYVYVHLQHSQLWIAFSGPLGRLFMSPAHHQIHHSRNPAHFNRNLGSCLAVWDWMFGTLHVPAAEREAFAFGVEPERTQAHTIRGELIAPFFRAAALLKSAFAAPSAVARLAPPDEQNAQGQNS
jgi:sterol desaturase/sphingolipid hydroxylase (fatty acid hydroxylase superfamily)